jgi:hypothetical protein
MNQNAARPKNVPARITESPGPGSYESIHSIEKTVEQKGNNIFKK